MTTRAKRLLSLNKSRTTFNLKKQEERAAVMMIMPFMIGFIIFALIPVVYAIVLSFLNYNSLMDLKDVKWIGLSNYIQVFQDEVALKAFLKSFYYILIYVPSVLIFGFVMALLLNKAFYGRTVIRTLILMPYVSNLVAVAMVFAILLDPFNGPVNMLLGYLGIDNPPMWLAGTKEVIPTVALISVWQGSAFHTIVYLAALQGVPRELYEAAEIDGASRWKKITNVTLPMISPTTFFLIIVSIINALQNYSAIKVYSDGGPGDASRVISYNIYEEAFSYNHFSYAGAQSVLLFLIVLVITIIQWKGQKKWVHY
ncbi:carbohydrate ABC transporter permease [Paenibacillus faecalis]|uniref:carbohydrate ABC transporter permease n=1 Tax=Paenibacillus faecalis TaxID=2079532 RepID=UPI000D0E5E79|nr:sugar ABC transporter permease [Paenibacillus faecalis]